MLRFQLDTTGNLLKDLIAFWPLDEPGGQRRDMLGYNPLTDNNTVTSAKGIGGQGTAAQFTEANSEYLGLSDNPTISVGDEDFSISAWIHLDSKYVTSSQNTVVAKWASVGSNSTLEYSLGTISNTDRLIWRVGDGTNAKRVDADALGIPTTGRWYFIVCWHDATNDEIGIQIDNGTADSVAHTTGVLNSTSGFAIGRNGDFNGNYFDGRIAYVGFWKRVLSQQERTDLYNYGRGNRLIIY